MVCKYTSLVITYVFFSIFLSVASADPLPFKNGKYVTDPKLCSMTDAEANLAFGDQIGLMTRNINGSELSNGYELFCSVKAAENDGNRIIFSALCDAEGESEEIVASYGFISETSFSLRGQIYTLCQTQAGHQSFNSHAPFLGTCPWQKGIWRSTPRGNQSSDIVHQFAFNKNAVSTSGEVAFSEYRDDVLAWIAKGTFGCSVGVSTCAIALNSRDGSLIETDFEDVETTNGERYRVFSSLSQKSKRRGGLSVVWHNGLMDDQEYKQSPSNVYMLTDCR